MGMGFLLAGVFIPFDLLVIILISGAGVYICIKVILYLRQTLAHCRWEG